MEEEIVRVKMNVVSKWCWRIGRKESLANDEKGKQTRHTEAEGFMSGNKRQLDQREWKVIHNKQFKKGRSSVWKEYHVLFNSLFKVLFIFPSRYLFAIGLVPIFSFRWSLPPILGCIPKQPDSSKAHRERPVPPQTGLSPSMTCCSKQLGRPRVRLESASRNYNSASQATQISNLSCSRFIRHY